jgi:excinuclease ABC subunit A
MQEIRIHRANEHNLQDISLQIPRDQLVVFTGVSGSGKSSLAFDTIFFEGQRRYVDSLSSYARQFIGQFEKPDVESIDGLSPAIAIDQKSTSRSPRSTVGTVTEIYDYLRLIYAKVGIPHDPRTGACLTTHSLQSIFDILQVRPEGTRLQILSPVVRGRKGEYNAEFRKWRKEGYVRVRIDGDMHLLEELPENYRLARMKRHDVELVIDRIILKHDDTSRQRLMSAIEGALKKSDGFVVVQQLDESGEKIREEAFSQHLSLAGGDEEEENTKDSAVEEMSPRLFSFNSPYGACPACEGLGIRHEIAVERLIPDPLVSVADGAIPALEKFAGRYFQSFIIKLAKKNGFSLNTPFGELSLETQNFLLYGQHTKKVKPGSGTLQEGYSGDALNQSEEEENTDWSDLVARFDGVVNIMNRRLQHGSESTKSYIRGFMRACPCDACHGARLKPFSLAVTIGGPPGTGKNIYDIGQLSIGEALKFVESIRKHLDEFQMTVARQPLLETEQRLRFLLEVGLDYLSLNRAAATLSGGEAQRIRLASQLGATMSGILYILDEPSIGLHQHNNNQLIQTLRMLRNQGNSLIVVEHDEDTIRAADWIVDIGPEAGIHGGHIVAQGTPQVIEDCAESLTGQYLSGKREITIPDKPRKGSGEALALHKANAHNLKNITVKFPLETLIGVTGLSGSGKSTLVFDLLHGALKNHFGLSDVKPEGYKELTGLEHIDKMIDIDQSPIGRSSRSNPATYCGIFDPIRNIFAASQEGRLRGYKPGRFSFNVPGGRCEACKGDGVIIKEMNFLPEVRLTCDICHGQRYNPETLEVTYRGKNIAEVLAMTVSEAREYFSGLPRVETMLSVLEEVGLHYIQLGQPAPTLSGGEAQRVKLATEFCRKSTGKTLYLLDEPSVGLHWADLEKLILILNKLVDQGNTVVVIEHNLDFIKVCDHLIDMGPEGGHRGGQVVAEGPPAKVATCPESYTGQFLKRWFPGVQ